MYFIEIERAQVQFHLYQNSNKKNSYLLVAPLKLPPALTPPMETTLSAQHGRHFSSNLSQPLL